MDRKAVGNEMDREPFVPLRIHLSDGRKLTVQFKTAAVPLKHGLLVFKGIKKEGSRVATGYQQVPYDRIERIEQLRRRGPAQGRRKAS